MEGRIAAVGNVRLSLAGGFELSRDQESVDVAAPAQRVLAFLALNDGPVHRGRLASVLWAGSSEDHAAGSLRSALWRIRQYGDHIVDASARAVRLAPGVSVDVRESMAWARRVSDEAHQITDADRFAALDSGDLLPEWSDEWVRLERERVRQVRLHALEVLSRRLVAAARYGEALEVALVALRSEPLRESAHRAVMSAHLAEGNTCEALRQFRTYRDLLHAQLGLEPSDLMRRMIDVEVASTSI